ncbi:MAG: amino acid ABC transporter permease [Bacillota bacterium]|jgi:glutamine transport system permease protein|nr:amino acid ABC transporter permease [Bacillota bacterium]HOA90666.1 amino acid ABC transporter permease [Bacillota bacterium]HPQ10223.1 amino acid ABC transporter permease [Bacillota bacterium]HPT61052.1 amino acid ABC transporter permease [Bacillota bacterium]HPZ73871.1 amino acid ABC transporter permease [Bacillota bacterium]
MVLKNWFTYVWGKMPILLEGTLLTIQLTAIAVGFGFIIGTFVGMGRISKNKIIKSICAVYIDFIRGTPLLVQILIVYMGLPQVIGRAIPAKMAAIISLSINSGAYVAEIVRAGIQSIDKGQTEAARSLGMTHAQTMAYIILPQAVKRIIPPLGNEFIAMLKDSSLVSVIALEELMRKAQLIYTRDYRPLDILIAASIIYLVMTFSISKLVSFLERRLGTNDK